MDWIKMIIVTGSIVIILFGLKHVFLRLKAKEQGFGPNSVKVIGVVLFLPIVLILAVSTDFNTETLAALLGTIAGYVLSNSSQEER